MSTTRSYPINEVKYFFVWSEKTGEEPKGYQPRENSWILIRPTAHEPEYDGTYPCTADFRWQNLEAEFTCSYHPSTGIFSDFKIMADTAKGGMQDVKSMTISFHRELNGEKVQVADDNGNLFMFVQLEFGFEGDVPISGDIWGKKALPGGWARDVVKLSEEEREELELNRWENEEKQAHFALLAERKKRKAEEMERESKVAEHDDGEWSTDWNDNITDQNGNGGLSTDWNNDATEQSINGEWTSDWNNNETEQHGGVEW